MTDIQRAARFYFLLKTGFASRIPSPTFSISPLRRSNFNLLRIEEELSAVHLRLARAYIENKPFDYVIGRFDRPTTFFYIDPPYHGCEGDYGKGIFSREDFGKLRDLLRDVKGKFIMSINNVPEIRTLYKEFRIVAVTTEYSAGKTGTKKGIRELLIMNFTPRKRGLVKPVI